MTEEKSLAEIDDGGRSKVIEAYDPMFEQLMMAREEKIRATALVMAIKYVTDTVIKDAEMLRELKHDTNQKIKPTHHMHVVEAAIEFERFLLGEHSNIKVEVGPKAQAVAAGEQEESAS